MWTLDNSLGFLMNRTARIMRRTLDAKLLKLDLTGTQYIVLVRLWVEDGISLSELGDRLYFDNPTLTGIVDRMERDGLLVRRRDEEDRRVVRVYLTSKGESLRHQIQHLAEETDADAWRGLSESQKEEIVNLHERIWKNLNNGHD